MKRAEHVTAFQHLVERNGHQVDEWITRKHETDRGVIIYGDCSRCLTELQLRNGHGHPEPSPEAADPCPASDAASWL